MKTAEQIAKGEWDYCAHYNMGAEGYGYGFRNKEYPRLSIIDTTYKKKKRRELRWLVDGVKIVDTEPYQVRVPDVVMDALKIAPVLTREEANVLELVPWEFVDLCQLQNDLAGVARPAGRIMPETPHSRVLAWLDGLTSKGMIEHGKMPWPADYKPENTFEHMRWSPTIRRRKQEGDAHG